MNILGVDLLRSVSHPASRDAYVPAVAVSLT
jgi:hypothetical protein